MALIKCPECGKEISDKTKKCIHCGYPISSHKSKVPIKKIAVTTIIILLFLVGILVIVRTNKLNESEKIEVKKVTEAISDIGEVTLTDETSIVRAENLYEALSAKCQRHVKNRNELRDARDIYNKIVVEETEKLIAQIGVVTLDSSDAISKAKSSYDVLPEELKENVSNVAELTAAITEFSDIQVADVIQKINDLETISLESENDLEEAKFIYYGLSDEERLKVYNYDDLVEAERQYEELSINNCIELINNIGNVTLESKNTIELAQNAYNSLSPRIQEKVTNYNILSKAYCTYEELVKNEEDRKKTLKEGDSFTTSKWQVTYKNSNVTAKIMPNSTSGYYTYYYADDDETFLDIILEIKNIDVDILGIENIIGDCEIIYDGKKMNKSYSLFTSEGTDVDSVYRWDGLDALEMTTLHVAIAMPREIQENKKEITVRLVIAGEEKIIKVR